MEEQPDENVSLFRLNLDAGNNDALRSAGSWAKVTGVAGIILGLIISAIFIVALIQVSNQPVYDYTERDVDFVFGGLNTGRKIVIWMMIIMGVTFIVGGIFSFSFGNKIGAALKADNQEMLNTGFSALRNYYALRGIMLCIALLLIILTFVSLM